MTRYTTIDLTRMTYTHHHTFDEALNTARGKRDWCITLDEQRNGTWEPVKVVLAA